MSAAGLRTYWPTAFSPLDDSTTIKGLAIGFCIAVLFSIFLFRRRAATDGSELPTFVLLEGYAIATLLMQGGVVRKLADLVLRRSSSPLYGFTSRHQVLASPAMATSALRKPHHVLNSDPAQWVITVRVFGSQESMKTQLQDVFEGLFAAVSKNLLQETYARWLMRDTYAQLRSLVPELVPQSKDVFVQHTELAPWLVSANPESRSDGTVYIDLYELARGFTTHVSVRVLAGADFLICYPAITTDLFALDTAFTLLALGVPTWTPLAIIQNAVEARKRLLTQIERFAERLEAVATGKADETLKARMADVNGVFWDRAALYRQHDLAMKDRASLDLALFWAMNANTSPFVFWVLAYIYADPTLLARVRTEVDPFVTVVPNTSDISGPGKIETLDAEALVSKCPLLKASFLESFRLAHEPTSLRYVEQDLSVTDPSLHKDSPPLLLRKGTYLSVPHTVQQFDTSIYPDPADFRPGRFIVEDKDGELKAGYGSLRPWGEGSAMCKGRVFAEREVLVTVGIILRCWEMEAVSGKKWEIPGKIPGTGVVKPAAKLRVKVQARVVTGERLA